MAKFPEPPDPGVLTAIPPDLRTLDAGTELWRVYARGGAHPRNWNTFRDFGPVTTMRFDHHEEPSRRQAGSILYGGAQIAVCVAESFQTERLVDRYRGDAYPVGFSLQRAITLLDLSSACSTRSIIRFKASRKFKSQARMAKARLPSCSMR